MDIVNNNLDENLNTKSFKMLPGSNVSSEVVDAVYQTNPTPDQFAVDDSRDFGPWPEKQPETLGHAELPDIKQALADLGADAPIPQSPPAAAMAAAAPLIFKVASFSVPPSSMPVVTPDPAGTPIPENFYIPPDAQQPPFRELTPEEKILRAFAARVKSDVNVKVMLSTTLGDIEVEALFGSPILQSILAGIRPILEDFARTQVYQKLIKTISDPLLMSNILFPRGLTEENILEELTLFQHILAPTQFDFDLDGSPDYSIVNEHSAKEIYDNDVNQWTKGDMGFANFSGEPEEITFDEHGLAAKFKGHVVPPGEGYHPEEVTLNHPSALGGMPTTKPFQPPTAEGQDGFTIATDENTFSG